MPPSHTKAKSERWVKLFGGEQIGPDLKKRALRGASLTLTAHCLEFALGMAGTVILARLVTPHDFGLVAMVLSVSLLLQNFGVNGFVEATIQRQEIDHKLVSTLFWVNVGCNLVLALLLVASAPIVAWFYKEPLLEAIVVAMAVSVLFGGLSNQHQALLIRNMEFYKTAVCELGATIISFCISIVLASWGWGYWALVAKWVSLPLVGAGGYWILCGWRPGLPARGTDVRASLKYALNTYLNFAITYFRRNIDKILIGRIAGSVSLGHYDRATQLALMIPNQLLNPIANVAMASFSRLASDREKYRNTYLQVVSVLAFVGMPLSAALTLVGRDLILLLLGAQWDLSGQIFTILGFSVGVMVLYITQAWLHLSLGTPDRWLRWNIIASSLTVFLFAVGLQFGLLGMAFAYSASFYILTGPALWYAGKPIGLRISSLISVVWKYFVSAVAAGLLCWFLLYSYHVTSGIFTELNVLIRILVAGSLCIFLYLGAIIGLYRNIEPISKFISVLRQMIPRGSPRE